MNTPTIQPSYQDAARSSDVPKTVPYMPPDQRLRVLDLRVGNIFYGMDIETLEKHLTGISSSTYVMFSVYRTISYPSKPLPIQSINDVDWDNPVCEPEKDWDGEWIVVKMNGFAMGGKIYYLYYVGDADTLFVWGDEIRRLPYGFPWKRG